MKVGLSQQIACAERELKLRRSVYPGLCARGKMREGEAQYEISAMENVLATLRWVEANEADIREWIKAKKAEAANG